MTKISGPLSPGQVSSYYVAKTGQERSYFSREAAGVWIGQGAAALGLEGEVQEEHLTRVAQGRDPFSNEVLIAYRPPAKEREPEWVKDDVAWRAELEDRFIEGRKSPFRRDPVEAGRVERTPVVPEGVVQPERTDREKVLVEMHRVARDVFAENLASPEGASARQYLKERGILPDTWKEFGVGVSDASGTQLVDKLRHYGPEFMRESGLFMELKTMENGRPVFKDRFRNRLMFPIESSTGETIAFAGRKLAAEDWGGKYENSKGTAIYTKGDEIYNFHRAQPRMNETGRAVVVEGYMDALSAHQAGVANVVALSGSSLSAQQASTLAGNAKTVILNLDADSAGDTARDKSIPVLLEKGLQVRSVVTGKDANEFLRNNTRQDYKDAIRKASPLVEVLAQQAAKRFDVSDPQDAAQAVKSMMATLERVPSESRKVMMAELESFLGVPKVAPEKVKESVEHRAAWDMTVSAAKSVSVTALPGGDSRIIRLHDAAVKEAVNYAERWTQVKMGGVKPSETTEKLTAAVFLHDTSRPVDGYASPQLHSHVVAMNMSPDQNGQFRSLNTQELYNIQATVEAVYQNRLAVGLAAMGYQITQGPTGATEIVGYSPEYLKAESPRHEVIAAEKDRLDLYGPKADQNIARNTRSAKLDQTPEEVKAAHLEHAEKFGNEPAKVVAEAARARPIRHSAEHVAAIADAGVRFAATRLGERTTVMEDFEVHRDALRFGRGVTTLADVEKAFERLKPKEFIEVRHWRELAPQQRWTTPDLVDKERAILKFMADGQNQVGIMAPRGLTKEDIREEFGATKPIALNHGQKHAVWGIIHSKDRMVGLDGLAGTGKTATLRAIKGYVEAYGLEVRGLAPTGNPTIALEKAGIPAKTIAGFLLDEERRGRARIYFVDESSLVDVHLASKFLAKLTPADRVLLVGDDKQHASLGAGRVFKELQDAGMEMFQLRKIERQTHEDHRQVVRNLSRGEIREALTGLEAMGAIREIADGSERHRAIAREYLPADLVIAPDNRSHMPITEAIRSTRREVGKLGEDVYTGRTLNARSDLHQKDVVLASSYRMGDVIVYSRDNAALGIKRGDRASVIDVSTSKNLIAVFRERDGGTVTYNPGLVATTASIYEPAMRSFAVGDRIQFTRGDKLQRIANRMLGTIERLDENGNASIRLDNSELRRMNLQQNQHISHGYVMTSHSSQCLTAEGRSLIHMDTDSPAQGLLTKAFGYVSVSRGREGVIVFTNSREDLDRVLLRRDEKATALSPQQVTEYQQAAPAVGVGMKT